MLPINETKNITRFIVIQSLWGCCFGQTPSVNHIIVCHDGARQDGGGVLSRPHQGDRKIFSWRDARGWLFGEHFPLKAKLLLCADKGGLTSVCKSFWSPHGDLDSILSAWRLNMVPCRFASSRTTDVRSFQLRLDLGILQMEQGRTAKTWP